MGCRLLLQGIFLTQELKPALLRCGQILYHGATWKPMCPSGSGCEWGRPEPLSDHLLLTVNQGQFRLPVWVSLKPILCHCFPALLSKGKTEGIFE